MLQCFSKATGQKHAANNAYLLTLQHFNPGNGINITSVGIFFAILAFFNCVFIIFDHVSCKLLG